jgi:hypothetical protein
MEDHYNKLFTFELINLFTLQFFFLPDKKVLEATSSTSLNFNLFFISSKDYSATS